MDNRNPFDNPEMTAEDKREWWISHSNDIQTPEDLLKEKNRVETRQDI